MASREGGGASLGSVLGAVLGCSCAGMEQGQEGPFQRGAGPHRPQTPLDLGDGSVPGEITAARGRGWKSLLAQADPASSPSAEPRGAGGEERLAETSPGLWEDEGSKSSAVKSH